MNQHILVLNGANLNLLGKREPEIYGYKTLADIEADLSKRALAYDLKLTFFQSNAESQLIDKIHHHGLLTQNASEKIDGVIINPAGFTHTSVVLRDALLAINKPFVEVHLSNIHSREAFRHHSFFSDKADALICGLGALGYVSALDYFIAKFGKQPTLG
ncbi:3-dehydroquinate dehydratase [Moraxella macacae 0408225]|uniref:3-dehydroquinate dehydratase n=1 Tax=Moraxella macacae 0408225 TaxID=1230338 RepID=L2F6Q0_9GAMM|nr:type II 3-dehydroquinate dehydratase [Moraxella macacae]ELA08471.1 3-dehydroquinate dehydratase [Moraxella macacae 0408225]